MICKILNCFILRWESGSPWLIFVCLISIAVTFRPGLFNYRFCFPKCVKIFVCWFHYFYRTDCAKIFVICSKITFVFFDFKIDWWIYFLHTRSSCCFWWLMIIVIKLLFHHVPVGYKSSRCGWSCLDYWFCFLGREEKSKQEVNILIYSTKLLRAWIKLGSTFSKPIKFCASAFCSFRLLNHVVNSISLAISFTKVVEFDLCRLYVGSHSAPSWRLKVASFATQIY